MAACNFKIPFSGPAENMYRNAKKAVQSQGGNFTGDSTHGNFDVTVLGSTIAGSYFVAGNEMTIEIVKKPFLLSCSMIENFLKSQIAG